MVMVGLFEAIFMGILENRVMSVIITASIIPKCGIF
jgi:hypothetical protein